METTIRKLGAWGAEPEEALSRMLDDEEFYNHLLWEFHRSDGAGLIQKHLEQGEYKKAFRIAHEQKGAAATLGLTPLYAAFSVLTEDLRNLRDREEEAPSETLQKDLSHLRDLWEEFGSFLDF